MAYINQETKKRINEELKKVKKNFNGHLKYSLAIRNHSTLVLTIRECSIDLFANWCSVTGSVPSLNIQVNQYYLDRQFDGEALELMESLNKALHKEHWDESDSMTDYFHCAYYVNINIGAWNKPFVATN